MLFFEEDGLFGLRCLIGGERASVVGDCTRDKSLPMATDGGVGAVAP